MISNQDKGFPPQSSGTRGSGLGFSRGGRFGGLAATLRRASPHPVNPSPAAASRGRSGTSQTVTFKCKTSVRAIRSHLPCVAPPRLVPPHSPRLLCHGGSVSGSPAYRPALIPPRYGRREAQPAPARVAWSGSRRSRGSNTTTAGPGTAAAGRRAGEGTDHTQPVEQDVRAPWAPFPQRNGVLAPMEPSVPTSPTQTAPSGGPRPPHLAASSSPSRCCRRLGGGGVRAAAARGAERGEKERGRGQGGLTCAAGR